MKKISIFFFIEWKILRKCQEWIFFYITINDFVITEISSQWKIAFGNLSLTSEWSCEFGRCLVLDLKQMLMYWANIASYINWWNEHIVLIALDVTNKRKRYIQWNSFCHLNVAHRTCVRSFFHELFSLLLFCDLPLFFSRCMCICQQHYVN